MVAVTEQQITAMAPNAAAVNNARKISRSGGFVKLMKSFDDTYYQGECSGSGSKNYVTSADFVKEEEPVFRCSCPSRQFPCKHSLALLFEILAAKDFESCEIPEAILDKRAKKEAREEKKQDHAEQADQKAKTSKAGNGAKLKKMKKQLEGMELAEHMVEEMLEAGIATLSGTSVKKYKDLSKQFGDYYLPGIQTQVNRIVIEMEALQKDSDQEHYAEAIHILVKLDTILKRAKEYLLSKVTSKDVEGEDTILYEELGGIWQLDQLDQLGLTKEHAKLLQLSFQVNYDEARKEYIDTAFVADLDTGEVYRSLNYRPLKALKYIKEEDSMFEKIEVAKLVYYPGSCNQRIRYEGGRYTPVTEEDRKQLKSKACLEIATLVKTAKNEIKNVLANPYYAGMLAFESIGKVGEDFVVRDTKGETLLLKDQMGEEETVLKLLILPYPEAFANQVLFGLVYYDEKLRRICMQPYSIVTEEHIIRLLY